MLKNIQINIQNIETETDRAVLIKCPNNSKYAGYKFWHPAKLVRSGKHSYAVSVSYTDEFKFRLIKYGNGKYNKYDVIKEIEIDVEEFEEAFGIMDENIQAPNKDNESYVIIEEPKKVEKEIKIENSLLNRG